MKAHTVQTRLCPSLAPASASRTPKAPFLAVSLLVLLASLFALAPASASADSLIAQQPGPEAGQVSELKGIAVSEAEGGDLYLDDASENQRIDQFEPGGGWVRAFGWGIVPGVAAGSGQIVKGSKIVSDVTVTSGSFWGVPYLGGGKLVTGPGIPPDTHVAAVTSSQIELSHAAEETRSTTLSVATGPGNVPTDEIQQLTVKATGGQFKLSFTGLNPGSTTEVTAPLEHNATAAQAQSALEALADIGAGNVSVTGGPGDERGEHPYSVEFKGRYADTNVRPLAPVNVSLTGGSPSSSAAVATVTEGAGALETCTTLCFSESVEEGGTLGQGSHPGQVRWPDAIAVDNDSSSSSYGDVYVVDQQNFRVEKYDREGHLLLIFGGEVDKGPHHPGNLCTAAYLAEGDACGAGVPGAAPGFFEELSVRQTFSEEGSNSIAVGSDGTVYVGDYRRIQEFEPDGAYKGELTLPGQQFVTSLAVDPESHVYALSPAVNDAQFVLAPNSGTFTLTFKGQTTKPLHFNASASGTEVRAALAEIRSALAGLSTIGSENLQVGNDSCLQKGHSGFCVQFVGSLAHADQPLMTASGASVEPRVEGAPGQLVELAGPAAADPSEVLQAYDTAPGAEPTHIALDGSGDLFVTDLNGGAFRFRAFNPLGALYAEFTSNQVTAAGGNLPTGIVIGGANLYAAAAQGGIAGVAVIPLARFTPGAPAVGEESAGDIEPTTATVRAGVDPQGFDTEAHFQYISEADCRANEEAHHECFQGAEETRPPVDLGAIIREDPVSAPLSGLNPATAYRYRAVAESSYNGGETVYGANEAFTTLPAIAIRDFTTQTVAPEEVVLKAELSPDNGFATEYEVCLGEEDGVYPRCLSHPLEGASGNEFAKVSATFEHLEPNTEYHYVLRATNSYGVPLATADQAFTTEPSAAEERAAEECPANGTVHGEVKSTLREQNHSLALPDCRAYEQVSPAYKAGYGVDLTLGSGDLELAPGGENALFRSGGAFAGAVWSHSIVKYFAHRTPSGWETQAALRRPYPDSEPFGPNAADPELDKWVFALDEGTSSFGNSQALEGSSYFGASDGSTTKASPTFEDFEGGLLPNPQIEPAAESPDLSTLLYLTGTRLLESDPLPTEPGGDGRSRLYEVSGAGGPSPTLSLFAEAPAGLVGTGCEIDRTISQGTNVISADGSVVFYTAPVLLHPGGGCGESNPSEVFARFAQAPPVEVSGESPGQCSSGHPCHGAAPKDAYFDGATPTGSAAWFTTAQPLIDSDADTGNDLYLARLSGGGVSELVQASAGEATANHPHVGEGAGVQGVLGVSEEGNVAYFVAGGELTEAPDPSTGQSAAQGAENLYAYEAESGQLKFVARLCSGPEKSGSVKDLACGANLEEFEPGGHQSHNKNDSSFWEGRERAQDQITPDGRYLLFSSFGRLTPDDTDNALDVYRYDLAAGRLTRLSFGRDGNDGDGNDDSYDAELPPKPEGYGRMQANELAGDTYRSISANGSVAIFRTAAPLTSHDTDLGAEPSCEFGSGHSGCDVYEWEEDGHGTCAEAGGCVRLISNGLDTHGVYQAVLGGPSGRDIAFITPTGLVPADQDGVADVYDAREGGGFPYTPPEKPCEGAETCHGESTHESLRPSYTSEETHSGGNGLTELSCAKGKHKVTKHGQVRCVPNKKHYKKKSHHKKHKRANANRGGAK